MPILKFQESLEMCACPKLLISGVLLINHMMSEWQRDQHSCLY
jgi:hypothetical protein